MMLADPDAGLRNNLAEALRDEGYEVLACADGAEALRLLRGREIDALVTELRMPGACGFDLIRKVRSSSSDAVIVVVTAHGQVETAVEAMRIGAQDYFSKPLILDELIFRLKRLLIHENVERENQVFAEQRRPSHLSEDSGEPQWATSRAGENGHEDARAGSPARPSPSILGSMNESELDLRSATRAFEREYVLRVLANCGFDKHAAADALGIGLSSLYRKMDELGIPLRSREAESEGS